ncbi:MAG: effector-binding domain-containing protein [Sphingobacteriales bacterium]|jgi:effector-binding domain-containing protein
MKVLKTLGIVLIALVVIVVIVSFFLPKEMSIEVSQDVDAEPMAAYMQVEDLEARNEWSTWSSVDTGMTTTVGETSKGVGASWSWDGPKSGKGYLTILEAEPYKSVTCEVVFEGAEDRPAIETWTFMPNDDNGTTVTYVYNGKMNSIVEKYISALFMKGMMTDMYVAALSSIKKRAEAMDLPKAADVEIVTMDMNSMNALTIKKECTEETVAATLEESYGAIMEYVAKNKIEIAGMPFAIYHEYNPGGKIVLEAGIPTATLAPGTEMITSKELPACKVAKATHMGDYMSSGSVHMALDNYVVKNNLEMAGLPWEVYANDPTTVSDASEIQTDIYYPIK